MVLKNFIIFLVYTTLLGVSGQLSIVQSPASVKFVQTSARLQSSELPQVIFNLFGLPNAQLTKWDGLIMGNLFKRPKAVMVISMTTDQPITLQQSQISFELSEDTGVMNTEYVGRRLQSLNWNDPPLLVDASADNMLLDVKSSYDEISSTQSLESILDDLQSSHWLENHYIGSLNTQSDDDLLFLGEIASITKTIEKIRTSKLYAKNSPTFLSFHISTLSSLTSQSDAYAILQHVLKEATVQLVDLYGGNVVVATVVTSPSNNNNMKMGRQLQQADNSTETSNQESESVTPPPAAAAPKQVIINYKAPKYSGDYPAIFNIILWSSVVIALALLWISWSIWHMDPGKDSVIYRMTTQRLKRD